MTSPQQRQASDLYREETLATAPQKAPGPLYLPHRKIWVIDQTEKYKSRRFGETHMKLIKKCDAVFANATLFSLMDR
jgi:nucleoside 2-deoxyribosyltransferase